LKADWKYGVLLIIIFTVCVVAEYYSPQPINWNRTFSKKDKIPYGSFIVYDYLSDIFPGKNVKETRLPIYNTLNDSNNVHSNYIIVNAEFTPDTIETKKLLEYVNSGNNVFIAAEYFDGPIADSLKVVTTDDIVFINHTNDSLSLNFSHAPFQSPVNFFYRKGTVDYYFTRYDTSQTTILGKTSLGQPDYIKIQHGNGAFYLNSVPMAFTNYNALKGNNSEYIFRALSYLPVANTWWDEYYKINNSEADTPLRYILSNAALERAYYLLIFGIILYIVFEGKRKQRIVPIIQPLQNTSLEFIETIGLLYYQKGTNTGIAKKKIQFFFDYLRSTFNLQVKVEDSRYYKSLAHMTGRTEEEIKDMFAFILKVNSNESTDEKTLLKLNDIIEDFYQKTK
jgi:hypothetical protein